MKTRYNFDALQSHYVYSNGKPVEYINVFIQDQKGTFDKFSAGKFIVTCNLDSKVKNSIIFKESE